METYQRLEAEFAEWNGLDSVGMVCCASGSSALHLAIETMELDWEIIIPDFTMIACPRAASVSSFYSTQVFVDCREDLLINPNLLPENLHRAAIMAVHIYGRKCDMAAIHLFASRYHQKVIEDLAEAHGIKPHPSTDAATWSFYRNKIIAGEEGGAVYFRNPAHAALARQLRSLGFTDDHDFTHIPRGWNHRMSNVHAELILESLEQAKANIIRRRRLEQQYNAYCPDEWRMPPRDAPWVYDIRIPGMMREQQTIVVKALQAAGINARHAFRPMHMQEEYRNCRCIGGEIAYRMSREVIYLPLDGPMPGVNPFDIIRKSL